MLARVGFALQHGLKKRKQLAQLSNSNVITSLQDLQATDLIDAGVKVLVLDFDGVLAAHGESKPSAQAEQWLKQMLQAPKGQIEYCILTNKPMPARQKYFAAINPQINFVVAPRKKPYPDGLEMIINKAKVQPEQVALLDDRILTGGLATLLAGTKFYYFRNAAVAYQKRPLTEIFFSFLRGIERILIGFPWH